MHGMMPPQAVVSNSTPRHVGSGLSKRQLSGAPEVSEYPMDLPPTFGLAAVFLLVLANGFFVATEFAIVAVRRSRLEQLVDEGRPGATAAKAVVGHLDTYIAATQFGITLAS